MCSIAEDIAEFKNTIVPTLFDELASVSIQVMRASQTQGAGGGQITGAASAVNATAVKGTMSTNIKSEKDEKSGKIVSVTSYKITFPDTFIVLSSDRIKVLASGSTPERIFKIIGLPIINGLYKAKCEIDK